MANQIFIIIFYFVLLWNILKLDIITLENENLKWTKLLNHCIFLGNQYGPDGRQEGLVS